jgi:hypothetical protein
LSSPVLVILLVIRSAAHRTLAWVACPAILSSVLLGWVVAVDLHDVVYYVEVVIIEVKGTHLENVL